MIRCSNPARCAAAQNVCVLTAKMEILLELYGNCQIRQRTQAYVNDKVKEVLRYATLMRIRMPSRPPSPCSCRLLQNQPTFGSRALPVLVCLVCVAGCSRTRTVL